MNTATAATAGFLVIGLIVAAVIFMPLAVIWSVNTLFATSIAFTFWNWLAVVVLGSFIRATPTAVIKK
jgi:hypothetical protein